MASHSICKLMKYREQYYLESEEELNNEGIDNWRFANHIHL